MANDRFSPNPIPPAESGVLAARPDTQSGQPTGPTSDERTMALLCHIGGFLTSFLVPLVLLLIKRRDSAFVSHHAKESLNFQLFLIVAYLIVSAATAGVGVLAITENMSGPVALVWLVIFGAFMGLLGIYELVVIIIASIAAAQGRLYRYPITMRFVR